MRAWYPDTGLSGAYSCFRDAERGPFRSSCEVAHRYISKAKLHCDKLNAALEESAMDNRQIDVTSEGAAALAAAVGIVWPNAHGGKVTHFKIVNVKNVTDYYKDATGEVTGHSTESMPAADGTPTLILAWYADDGFQALPYPHDRDAAIQLITGWLKTVDYGEAPDHDGSNGKGWRIFNDSWGHVAGSHYGVLGVQPAWAMYGK